MARITLTNLTKRWGEAVAVDDQSLTVEDGTFMVLLGPSGCGKTTTMRIIAGLDADVGPHPLRRRRRDGRADAVARHRDGVPELRPPPAHDGGRKHRLSAEAPRHREG